MRCRTKKNGRRRELLPCRPFSKCLLGIELNTSRNQQITLHHDSYDSSKLLPKHSCSHLVLVQILGPLWKSIITFSAYWWQASHPTKASTMKCWISAFPMHAAACGHASSATQRWERPQDQLQITMPNSLDNLSHLNCLVSIYPKFNQPCLNLSVVFFVFDFFFIGI